VTTQDVSRARSAIRTGSVALLGIPLDENSSYLRGCALGPARVREIMSHVAPSGGLPPTFQVLIEATFESNVPISIRYVAHHIYPAK